MSRNESRDTNGANQNQGTNNGTEPGGKEGSEVGGEEAPPDSWGEIRLHLLIP